MKLFFTVFAFLFLTSNLLLPNDHKWQLVDSINVDSAYYYKCIDCYDEFNCVAFGSNKVPTYPGDTVINSNRFTTNGGQTWSTSMVDSADAKTDYLPEPVIDVSYVSENLCIALCDRGRYFRSTDNCKTWEQDQVGIKDPAYYIFWNSKIKMLNEQYGAITYSDELHITTDGGLTWDYISINTPEEYTPLFFRDVSLPDENTIIILSYNKEKRYYLLKSNDKGISWQISKITEKKNDFIENIYFFNGLEGFAAGWYWVDPPEAIYDTKIYYTSDAGENWEINFEFTNDIIPYPFHFFFQDRYNGITAFSYNKFLKTSDGGDSWFMDNIFDGKKMNDTLSRISFSTRDVIYGCGRLKRKIYKYDKPLGVNNKHLDGLLSLYPNPAADHVSIRNNEDEIIDVAIYDILSRKMLSRKIIGRKEMQIDVSGFAPGFYFVICDNGHEIKTFKFIKK